MASDSSRPQNPTQVSNLPGLTQHITGHNDETGKATILSSTPAHWSGLYNNTMGFSVAYTTSTFPPSLNSSADIHTHTSLMESGGPGLVNPGGTVCRIVDFGPGAQPLMHRTQSLDYGVVLEGKVEMEMDDGKKVVLGRGDVAVQRGTNHAWRNLSKDGWARMFFVLQDAEVVEVGGEKLAEEVSGAGEEAEKLTAK